MQLSRPLSIRTVGRFNHKLWSILGVGEVVLRGAGEGDERCMGGGVSYKWGDLVLQPCMLLLELCISMGLFHHQTSGHKLPRWHDATCSPAHRACCRSCWTGPSSAFEAEVCCVSVCTCSVCVCWWPHPSTSFTRVHYYRQVGCSPVAGCSIVLCWVAGVGLLLSCACAWNALQQHFVANHPHGRIRKSLSPLAVEMYRCCVCVETLQQLLKHFPSRPWPAAAQGYPWPAAAHHYQRHTAGATGLAGLGVRLYSIVGNCMELSSLLLPCSGSAGLHRLLNSTPPTVFRRHTERSWYHCGYFLQRAFWFQAVGAEVAAVPAWS